jgi:hypothetical protein
MNNSQLMTEARGTGTGSTTGGTGMSGGGLTSTASGGGAETGDEITAD